MSRLHLHILAGVLSLLGLTVFAYKHFVIQLPLLAQERTEIWRIETELRFRGDGGPVKLAVALPVATGRLQTVDQTFVSPGYGLTVTPGRYVNQRATFSRAEASGEQVIYTRLVVNRFVMQDQVSREPVPQIEKPTLSPAAMAAADEIIRAARSRSADSETLARLIVQRLQSGRGVDEATYLVGQNPSIDRIVSTAVDLLVLADVPARIVNGIALEPERRNARFVHWLEVFQKGIWRTIHVGETRPDVIRDYLPWWRGRSPFAVIEGGTDLSHHISVSRSYELSMRTALNRQRATEKRLIEFSFFGLPLQTQFLFRSLVVIPVGIFLLVVLRNVVGIKTFGTFMPVLIALAFRETGLGWGLLFFVIIVALGLAVRFYLEQLKLLLVPRLAVGVIVVVLIIAALTVVFHRLGFGRGLSLGLFPIVILTMTIERMTTVWEEQGAREALQQAAGSLAVGAAAYLIMNLPQLEHLLFVFPELLLLVLAGTLLLGRYSGYRLTELWRFRALAK